MHTFETSLKAKLIYVFAIPDEPHAGCLKVGDATFYSDKGDAEDWPLPNSELLDKAARERIDQYTGTAGIAYQLLHTEIALYKDKDDQTCAFRDHDVHRVLERSGVKKKAFDGVSTKSQEWFCCDLETVKSAITAVKAGKGVVSVSTKYTPIIFRPEQQDAIQRTVKRFKKPGQRMLWNAKMRFGKTLTALQVASERDFRRTLIITHRPVVSAGWFEDFEKIFYDRQNYRFGSRDRGNSLQALEHHAKQGGCYVFFASIQDLRGSEQVGGKFDKNDLLFNIPWDYLIVDEAHEGTLTERGEAVIQALTKPETCVLQLSGTPFNLLPKYDEKEIFTWDYVMEQRAKMEWNKNHLGDDAPNPYESLPAINIYTYDLGRLLQDYLEDDEDRAFNFREFFRTREDGGFVHEDHIDSFLNLLCRDDPQSLYPYSRKEYRNIFRHTLWMLPGVKAARALSQKLSEHPVFAHFKIVNVAGDGDKKEDVDDEVENRNALQMVKDAIGSDSDKTYTITLSCGRLTTGVSVPPWTGVFMMAGTYKSTATAYMQTIFRVQTPYTHNGRMKSVCYAFDFAPDRTLTVLAETAKVSTKVGQQTDEDRRILTDFLNFCPVIALDGSEMKPYDVDRMMAQLKKAQIERVVSRGFEDGYLYNNELYHLDDGRMKDFQDLQNVIGKTKALPRTLDIDINRQGLTNEQYEEIERIEKKKKAERTPEEEEMLRQREEQREQRGRAIAILRGISIRMPLMLYGADINDEDRELTIDNFTALVDDRSWEEFMPRGVTKELFERFKRYYDKDVFREAGKRIRRMARTADRFTIEERIERITDIFATFRNPDKETVLTPWRVVNLHLSRTLGGYTFFDEAFERELSAPRAVDIPGVTAEVFRPDALILEINSKSGLYPLYAAYSIYQSRLRAHKEQHPDEVMDDDTARQLWDETLRQNILVLCKTPMAVSITRRTLAGFRPADVNARDYPNLIQELIDKPAHVADTLRCTQNFWHLNNPLMKIDAVIGNPPYQLTVAKKETDNGQKRSSSIFQYFQDLADQVGKYTSLIYPGGRWIHRSGKGLEQFGMKQINDPHLSMIHFFPSSEDLFDSIAIADGISFVFKNMEKKEEGFTYFYTKDKKTIKVDMSCPGEQLMPLDPMMTYFVERMNKLVQQRFHYLHDSVFSQKLFSIESDFVERNPALVREYNEGDVLGDNEIKLFTNDKAGKSGRARWYVANKDVIKTGVEQIGRWKVVVSSANAGGQKRSNQLAIMDNRSAFGRSRVALKTFVTEREAQNFFAYCRTDFIRYTFLLTDEALTSLAKLVPDIGDYTDENGVIDFTADINAQLYRLFEIDTDMQSIIAQTLKEKEAGR